MGSVMWIRYMRERERETVYTLVLESIYTRGESQFILVWRDREKERERDSLYSCIRVNLYSWGESFISL